MPLLADDTLVGALLAAVTHGPGRILDVAEVGSLTDLGQVCAAVVQRALLADETESRRARERVGLVLERPELLVPAFQPIVALVDGHVVGYEALSRFQAEPYEPPTVWFANADRVGLGSELQALAIHRALAVAMAAGLPDGTFLSLNASPRLLADPLLVRATSGFFLERVVIEITEEEAVGDYAIMRDTLAPYRAAGARIAIDDVGAGYASLRHLTELQPDFIKLDALLMPRLGSDPAGRAMVRALSGFAEEIGAVLIAEGVERPEDLALLARARLPIMVQGFAIARPGAPWPEILPLARQAWATTGSPRPAALAGRRAIGARRA
ncbi:MAG: EAL domain-containing protein [Chloroflexota bacterium]